ncbi:hypothetical protein ACR6C2_45025 [Streptomyces sp. INA 01156]
MEATAPGSRRGAAPGRPAHRVGPAGGRGRLGGVPELDLRRESWMRARLAEATARGERAAAVVEPSTPRRCCGRTPARTRHRTGTGTGAARVDHLADPVHLRAPRRAVRLPGGHPGPEWQDMVLRAGETRRRSRRR